MYDRINFWIDMDKHVPDQPHSIWYQEEALLRLLKTLKFKNVLDVGCSSGRMLKLLVENFEIEGYSGVDLSTMRMECARKLADKYLGEGKIKRYTLINDSWLAEFNFKEKFDLVLGIEILMHIVPEEIHQFISKMWNHTNSQMITLDYYPLPEYAFPKLAEHNFLHQYLLNFDKDLPGAYVREIRVSNLQSIFHWWKDRR